MLRRNSIRARDVHPGDIVRIDGKAFEVLSRNYSQTLLVNGPRGSKHAIEMTLDGATDKYFMYPSAPIEVIQRALPVQANAQREDATGGDLDNLRIAVFGNKPVAISRDKK
jgi:hypothetical protein